MAKMILKRKMKVTLKKIKDISRHVRGHYLVTLKVLCVLATVYWKQPQKQVNNDSWILWDDDKELQYHDGKCWK